MESHTVLHPLALREALSHEKRREKVKKSKSEKLAILRRFIPSGEFFSHFWIFYQKTSAPEVYTITG